MKTVMNAVKEFSGTHPRSFIGIDEGVNGWTYVRNPLLTGYPVTGYAFDSVRVCSLVEYDALVNELSTNCGRCDISFSEHCSNETVRLQAKPNKIEELEAKIIECRADGDIAGFAAACKQLQAIMEHDNE